jgi:hypothetical protein
MTVQISREVAFDILFAVARERNDFATRVSPAWLGDGALHAQRRLEDRDRIIRELESALKYEVALNPIPRHRSLVPLHGGA